MDGLKKASEGVKVFSNLYAEDLIPSEDIAAMDKQRENEEE
jgi:hypothetical protein